MEEIWQKWLRVLRLATFSGGPGAGGRGGVSDGGLQEEPKS